MLRSRIAGPRFLSVGRMIKSRLVLNVVMSCLWDGSRLCDLLCRLLLVVIWLVKSSLNFCIAVSM